MATVAAAAAAAEEAAEARRMELEAEANRWAVLFYAHQALRAFRAGHSRDFRELRDVLTGRPLAWGAPAQTSERAPEPPALDRLCFSPSRPGAAGGPAGADPDPAADYPDPVQAGGR